jgi:hypothetical protein
MAEADSSVTIEASASYGRVPERVQDVVFVAAVAFTISGVAEAREEGSSAIASVADNVPDGWRTVAPHLAERPGADVLIVGGGAPSISLYALPSREPSAPTRGLHRPDPGTLEHARLGANVLRPPREGWHHRGRSTRPSPAPSSPRTMRRRLASAHQNCRYTSSVSRARTVTSVIPAPGTFLRQPDDFAKQFSPGQIGSVTPRP